MEVCASTLLKEAADLTQTSALMSPLSRGVAPPLSPIHSPLRVPSQTQSLPEALGPPACIPGPLIGISCCNSSSQDLDDLAPIPPTPVFVRREFSSPGNKFRQHEAFSRMQTQLDESNPLAARLIVFTEKNKQLLNAMLRQNVRLLETSLLPVFLVPACRKHLDFKIKRNYLKLKLRRLRKMAVRNQNEDYEYQDELSLEIDRAKVLESSFAAFEHLSLDDMRKQTHVQFDEEEGIDAGGLTKEWYSILLRELCSPNCALFVRTNDNVTLQPSASSSVNPRHLDYFKFTGRIIAKAICDGQLIDPHFTRSFYKHILGLSVTYHDLEAFDLEYYKSLKMILEHSLEDLGLELFFSAETRIFDEMHTTDLIERGREIQVLKYFEF